MIEAMAFGIPVVATRVGGIPKVICDGINGILVDSSDPNQIAAAVRRMSENEKLTDAIRKNGFKTAKNYTIETAVGRTVDILQKRFPDGFR